MTTLSANTKGVRLVSMDALRGFDMLWIMGLDRMIRVSAESLKWGWLETFAVQMEHPKWAGFTCYDMIFPLFLFIAGVAIPFSLFSKSAQQVSKKSIYLRIIRRTVLLILLGIVYNRGLAMTGLQTTRFASVLGLIGIGYCFASIIVMNCDIRRQLLWFFGILLGYWAALMLFPVPGYGAGILTPEACLPAYIDQRLLPGRLYGGTFDPEGIMSCISAICTALAGALTGQWLRREDVKPAYKGLGILAAGIAAVLVGLVWSYFLPIIKHIWTGSFVMLTTGLSLLLLGLFYLVIDVLGLKKWTIVFTVIGMNSITIYMAVRMVDFQYTAKFIFGGLIQFAPEVYQASLLILGAIALEWLLLYGLYRKKIFLRL